MVKNRKTFLQELLVGIYKTDRLSFNDNEVYIMEKSIFYNCDLSNNKKRGHSYERYEQLFNATFNDPKIKWCIDTDGGGYNTKKSADKVIKQKQFSVSVAIDNSFAYLKSIGVNFDIFSKNEPIEIEGIGDILYSILHGILYLIFFWRDEGKPIAADDDISSLLSYNISSVNLMLVRKAYEINGYITASSDNSVVEFGTDKSNCNRFIYVTINDLSICNKVLISTSRIVSNIVYKKKNNNNKIKIDSSGYNWLMSNLGIYFPSDSKVYRLTSLPATIDSSDNNLYGIVSFPEKKFISNIHPDPSCFNEFGIYYLFNLDENKIKAFYPDVRTPHELRSAIILKAYRELSYAFKKRISLYINDVILYIEDVIACIMLIDPEKLITGIIDEETVSVFNIDYNRMLSFYKENNAIEEVNLYLYMMIDGALQDFSNQLYYNYQSLTNSVFEYEDSERIKEHMEKLHSFILSDRIKKAIEIQKEDEERNPSAYRLGIDKMYGEEYLIETNKKRTPGLFKTLFCNINSYYLFLKQKQEDQVSNCP